MNSKVKDVLGEFGYKKNAEDAPKPKVHPSVAKMLAENLGVNYAPEDIMEAPQGGAAMNPLGAPGDAPASDPNVAADQQGTQTGEPTQDDAQVPGATKRREMPRVKLKSSVNRITTLQDMRDKMNEITQRITTIDTLSQTLIGDQTTDNDLQKHKQTLKGAVDALASSVRDLQNAFKD